MSSADEGAGPSVGAGSKPLGLITPLVVDHLRGTKPWVRLLSIVGFVTSALVLIVALVMPFGGALSGELGGAVGGVAMAAVYLLLGCLYFFPSLFLFRYASAIRRFLETGDGASLELALSHQRSFWRLVGIMTVVVLCFYAVALVIAVMLGIATALR